jgi:hypothetical protein
MCDERERLIAYVYGEAAAGERQQIDNHLGECHVCRAEVSGLRSVRDDLLAWDVPKHEPVWRPFVPAPVAPVRAGWPAWALAAAAGVLFTAGLAGGMAARGWSADPRPAAAAAVVAPNEAPSPQPASVVSPAELARIETAILERVRREMTAQLRASASAPSNLAQVSTSNRVDNTAARLAALERRLAEQEEWRDDQISLNALFNGQIGRVNNRTSSLSEQIELQSRLQRVGLDAGSR